MRLLSYQDTKKLLDRYKLPLVHAIATRSEKELLVQFAQMRKPVVIKPSGPGIMHKTEKGLVFLNVTSREQAEHAARRIRLEAGTSDFQILMQEQARGAELIIGAKVDKSFGPVVLFGTGGIYAELLDDVSVRVAPLTRADATEMLYETHAKKFINGFRSMKMDEEGMISLLLKTSALVSENKDVMELDFNPVIADDKSAKIVDARVLVADQEGLK